MTNSNAKIRLTKKLLSISRDPGSALHQARRKKKLSIPDTAKAVKTTPEVLRRLESWDVDNLMESRFLEGLVRRFCDEVGLDARTLLKGVKPPKNDIPTGVAQTVKSSRLGVFFLEDILRKGAVVVATVAVLAYIAWFGLFNVADPKIVSLEAESIDSGSGAKVSLISGRVENGDQVFVNGFQLPVRDDGTFSGEVRLSVDLSNLSVRAVSRDGAIVEQIVTL